jgi:thiol-disulfide isomerase/thioredoxin
VGTVITITALALAAVIGLGVRRVNGRFRTPQPTSDPVLADLGVTPQTPLTLLQFSSAFCAPCRVTRVLCADLAASTPGVRHIEVDAESHVDAIRALQVWRTPTVLLIDGEGRIRRRASGAPSRAQLCSAVESVLGKGSLAA